MPWELGDGDGDGDGNGDGDGDGDGDGFLIDQLTGNLAFAHQKHLPNTDTHSITFNHLQKNPQSHNRSAERPPRLHSRTQGRLGLCKSGLRN